jgi:steroid delta-isomerase-like uncharacterized protein
VSFDLATYMVACARDCLDEPLLFGPRRMIEAAARVAAEDHSDEAMAALGERIAERRGALLGMEREQLALWLDELLGELATEARLRALAGDGGSGSPDAETIADLLYRAYNSHDVKAAVALYAPEAEHHEVAQGRRARGAEEIGTGLAHFMQAFPDCRWTARGRVVSEAAVAVPYLLSGTLAAPMGPFRELGRRLALEGLHLLRIRGGLIVSSTDYWDASTFTRQMSGGS